MAILTRYGSLWGSIPNTAGRVLWVAPTSPYLVDGRAYDRSDDNDGLSPERALSTIQRANVLATANAGDVVVMLPGTHVLTAAVTASVAGVTYMGLPSGAGNRIRQKTVVQATASAACFALTAADVEFAYLHLIPTTANSGITMSVAADRAYIHHCSFDMFTPAASATTLGIDATGAASQILIEQCVFHNAGAQGAAIDMTATRDSIVQDCEFMTRSGVWAAAMTVGALTTRLRIHRCNFFAAGVTATITAGISGTGATTSGPTTITGCFFHSPANGAGAVVVPIDNFGNTCAIQVENYTAIQDITTSGTSTLIILTN